jgi:hypothetical protein
LWRLEKIMTGLIRTEIVCVCVCVCVCVVPIGSIDIDVREGERERERESSTIKGPFLFPIKFLLRVVVLFLLKHSTQVESGKNL